MTAADKWATMDRRRRYEQRHRDRGLCKRCSEPIAPGRTLCQFHCAESKDDIAAKRARRRAAGACIFCGLPLSDEEIADGRKCHYHNDCIPSRGIRWS